MNIPEPGPLPIKWVRSILKLNKTVRYLMMLTRHF
jgi:hypothetical protein